MPETYRTLNAPWEKIRADYESGDIPVDELACKWSIRAGTLRSRASREKWATPNRMKKAIGAVVEMFQGSRGMQDAMAQLSSATGLQHDSATEESGSVASKLQQRAATELGPADYQAFVAEIAMRSVRSGLTNVKRPTSWSDITKADSLARRALGLDSKGGGGGTTMIRISGPAGTVDFATSVPVDMTDIDESEWDD
jgi:hypothetical protein